MNGAQAIIRTLVDAGGDGCFKNPGTSEMHFVAALDTVGSVRCVLGLFEGVATGAADGYARLAERPAATLLHLGPGLANGLANVHNARRAHTPMVNVVGDHATYHRELNAPLTSDIEGTVRADGTVITATNISIVTYAGDGKWRRQEDVYNPLEFGRAAMRWCEKAREHGRLDEAAAAWMETTGAIFARRR